jgi:hypothetical protein
MGIGDPQEATKMDPAGLDRLDYFSAQLKRRGIYFGWSHTFGLNVRPGDRSRLASYDEIVAKLKGNTYALINFAEDVQDLMIEMVVNLLRHRNPYTGRSYAEEPALSFIELQNEDDIFWYSSTNGLNACPTYRNAFVKKFSAWLAGRYKTDAALKAAWGGSLKAGEGLSARNIVPEVNPWFFSDQNLPKQRAGMRRRLLDTAQFLHESQNRFYSRFVKAIRDAGYEGPICGSPWQAPSMLPHYYNLRSDALVGYIDRHNYFGGRVEDSMLRVPGSGYLSSGLQQVADRPFGLSEWIHVFPSLYSAEGPAIVAAYGLGLQGWDASYEFQSQAARRAFDDRVGAPPWGVWEADTPTQVGQYPSLARMVLRGDVKEGPVISSRRVSPTDLGRGEFSFTDEVRQEGDVKTFGGSVPQEALAAGRVVVEFAPESRPSTLPDLARFREGGMLVSATGQLRWGEGFFTVDTAATKAVVGFAGGKPQALGGVEMTLGCPYASLFLTALGRTETLEDAKTALLTAMARSSNTGLSYFVPTGKLTEVGRSPVLMEPVKATITLSRRKAARVHILDHDGRRTGKTVPITGGRFTIDGARDRTPYYEVEF